MKEQTNKKKSKYKPEEIKGYLPDGTVILKEGVKRQYKFNHLDPDKMDHINKELIFKDKYYKLMLYLYGESEPNSGVSE